MCSFIFSSSSPFPPLISPPLSPLVHPFPQTNQFASFPSILLAMPGHALSFVSRRYLHFQRPLIILSIPVASITLLPSRHLPIFRECSLSIHPILLITTQFHSQAGPCMCVCVLEQDVMESILLVDCSSKDIIGWGVGRLKPPPSPSSMGVRWHLI